MKNKLACFLFLVFLISETYAQEIGFKIRGMVTDAEQKLPLPGVSVILKLNNIVVRQALTNEKGFFKFEGLQNGNYELTVSFVGFKTISKSIEIKDADVFAERFVLETDEKQLKEVKIDEVQTRMEQKGDTTEIKANAYKTNPDATAEDLIKKMPGITSENGTIKAQGEEVKKVLIDGKEFFGDDPNVALKTIPADMIEKVQVYDKLSDKAAFTGFDDGSGQKTINIITNKSKRKGVFGKAYAGYGYNNVYQGGGNINEFNKSRKLSVIGMTNNINEQNFSIQDIAGVAGASGGGGGGMRGGSGGGGSRGMGGPPGMGGGPRGGGDLSNFLVSNQNGIATTHAAGVNYIDQYGSKVTINAAYFFNYSQTRNIGSVERTYLTGGDRAQHYLESNQTKTYNTNHRFNLKLGFNPDSLNQFIYSPRLGAQLNSSYSGIDGSTDINQFIINKSLNNSQNKVGALSFGNTLLWMRKFAKPGRTFSAELNQDYTKRDPRNLLFSQSSYYGYLAQDTTYSQLAATINSSNLYSSSISFTEPIINKNHQLEFTLNPRYTEAVTDKQTHLQNPLTGNFDLFQNALSNNFNNQIITHNEGVNYRYAKESVNISFGAAFQGSQLTGTQLVPFAYKINKTFNNVLPNARIQFKPGKNHTLRLFYRSDITLPSASQLQTAVDNSNPLLLSTGNANLNQAFNQRFGTRYNYVNPTNSHNAFLMAVFNNAFNYISNSTLIVRHDTLVNGVNLKRGTQLVSPVNVSGYRAFRTFANYSMPIKFIKCNFNLNGGYTYSKTPTVINDVKYFTLNNNYNGGFSLSSNISEKIDFNIGPNLTYAKVVSNGMRTTTTNYYITNVTLKGQWIFYKGFFIHANGSYYDYRGLGQGFNRSFTLFNGGAGVKFLKNNSGELRLMVFDMLNQNNNINRTVTETYTEDTQNLVLRRYFMLTFTYTFKKFAQGTTMPEEFKNASPTGMPPFGAPTGMPPHIRGH